MTFDNLFKPKGDYNLVRCGRDNDGGYLVSKKTIGETGTVISFGIFDDCSFETQFKKIKPVQVHCYDKTVNKTYWKKRIYNDIGASLYNLNYSFLKNTFSRYFEFKKFFKDKTNYLTIDTIRTGSVKKILNNSQSNLPKPFFFKIDIEGSEYRILDELIEFQNLICGLVIEFHDLDLNLNKVEKFIKNFNLNLTHIHPNNYGELDLNGNPTVLEMTFEKKPIKISENLNFPNKYDQPNDPQSKDIVLKFK